MSERLSEEVSAGVRWTILPSHQRPSRTLYQTCAPEGRVVVLKLRSQRSRETRE